MSAKSSAVDAFVNEAKTWQRSIQVLRGQIKKTVVKTYVKQTISVEKAGVNVDFKVKREPELPKELTQILNKDSDLTKAFHALTPGRQRGDLLHFTGAKQSKIRTARIEKYIPKILAGKGINDR